MKRSTELGLLLLVFTLPLGVRADDQMGEAKHVQTWKGTLRDVDAQDNTVSGRHWLLFTRTFSVGDHCAVSAVDKKEATLGDLRPGERVRIRYQMADGVRVADRIAERPLRYQGIASDVDRKDGLITLQRGAFHKTFRLADDCAISRSGDRSGTLDDVKPGDRVSVVYELPAGSAVAYRIHDPSQTFVGTLGAVNPAVRTVKVNAGAGGGKEFTLAPGCRILVNGKEKTALSHLSAGRQYVFTYEEIHGVNVAERIAPVTESKAAETASAK